MKSNQISRPLIITEETITQSTMQGHRTCTALHAPNARTILADAFMWNHDLESTSFPEALSIGESAFSYGSDLESLQTIDIPKVKNIDKFAFSASGLREVNAPSAKIIAQSAFALCHNLKSASLPQAEIIDETGFYDCPQLASIAIPQVESIGASAFAESAVTKVEAPRATEICKLAFQACKKLHTFVAPKATHIADSAFEHCPELKQAYLANAQEIGVKAFKTSTKPEHLQEFETLMSALDIDNDQAIDSKLETLMNALGIDNDQVIESKLETLMNALGIDHDQATDSKQVSENAILDENTSNLERLLVHQDLITAHGPETDRTWWLSRGINPEKTTIDSLDAWAERQNITLSDTDALFILYRLNQDPDYRPTWPEIGIACPNLPFHLLLKVLPEDKQSQSLPLLSAATLAIAKPQRSQAKNELLSSYFQGINMRASTDAAGQASSEKISHAVAYHQAKEHHTLDTSKVSNPLHVTKHSDKVKTVPHPEHQYAQAHQAESHEKEAAAHASQIEISEAIESIAETLTIQDMAKIMLAKADEPRLSKDTSLFAPGTDIRKHDTDTQKDAEPSGRGPASAA